MGGGEVVRPRSWRRAFLATAIDDKPATLLLGLKGIPSRRTLSRFDEVMGEYGLWGEAWLALVRRNLETGAIAPSDSFVADTPRGTPKTGHTGTPENRPTELNAPGR